MLRPAVAATNCARAGKATGLDIDDGAPVDGRKPDTAMQGVTDPPKCPGGGRPSTTARKQRYRAGPERGFRGGRCNASRMQCSAPKATRSVVRAAMPKRRPVALLRWSGTHKDRQFDGPRKQRTAELLLGRAKRGPKCAAQHPRVRPQSRREREFFGRD